VPDVPADSSRVLTFEQARALGLINLDDLPGGARESES
jgi:hypothetical protein